MMVLCISVVEILTDLRESMMPVAVRIRGWLMQPEVWRFVGLASTVVGLLCYALSSAFNHLFGKWYFWKIFLYILLSLFICLLILFPDIWQRFLTPRFETHSPFWFLNITSVYSFYFDKAVSGKPDVYNLISCAAFAIMSLSLARRTHCGLEKGLLYFFLGVLIVRLMKIKIALGILGVCFGLFINYLRSSDAPPPEYVGLESVVIEADDSPQAASTDIASMANQLKTCMKKLKQKYLNVTYRLFPYLEDNYELSVTDHNYVIDALPSRLINDLHETVKVMMEAGFDKECCDVYTKRRKECLEDCLINKLLFGGINIEKEKRTGIEFQDFMIRRLAKACKVALRILLPGEQRLCDRVFLGFSDAAYLCFIEVSQGAVVTLLDFVDAVASGSPSAWRLFKILDMFETLRDLIPEFQSLFPEAVVNEAIKIQNRLGEASRDIFMDLGNLISCSPTPDNCWLLPMTQSVINCIIAARESRQILERILEEYPKVGNEVGKSSFSAQMEWLIELLERKLIGESKNYKDPASHYFFMMLNWSYLEQKAKEEGLETMMGDDWFPRNEAKVRQYLELYLKSSWEMVLDFLKLESYESAAPNVRLESMIEKLNLFNKHFRETCNMQSTWFVFDERLKEQIRKSLENILLPAYGKFIGRFEDVLGKHSHEYIKYGIGDIQDRLNHLFLGSNGMNQ